MRNKFICLPLIIILFAGMSGNSQQLHQPIAVAYAGLGAYSLNHSTIFSFTANQASLAQLKNTEVAIYGERRFSLSEFNNYAAAVGFTTRSGNFGLKAGYYGSSNYNETQLGLAYGRKLGSKLDIGAQFNYNGINIAGYGSASAISVEAGTILHVTEKFHAGIHINNPVGGEFGKDQEEKLSSVYTVGFGYEASDKFFISTEIVKEEDQPVNVNAGMQYKFVPQLVATIGVSTAVPSWWMGVGLYLKVFRVDVTAAYHPQLGITPGIMLLFSADRKKEE